MHPPAHPFAEWKEPRFGYYNLVRIHQSLRMTPAMAAGVTRRLWSVGELLELAGK